ncbi:IPT/TIG domain-containing protein [Reichenbachiella sp.]
MKVLIRNISFIFLLAFLIKCEENEVTSREYPRLSTLAVTEINEEGAKFNAKFILRGDFEVIRYGFVWGNEVNPTLESNNRMIISENTQSDNFSAAVKTTLVPETSYFVRAFVETNDYVVYGENVSFESLGSGAPDISGLHPLSLFYNDTLVINGQGFSYLADENEVKLGELVVDVQSYTDTLLKVVVPESITSTDFTVKVSVKGNINEFPDTVSITLPLISNISPTSAYYGDEIEISGKYFNKISEFNTVLFNYSEATIVSATNDKIRVTVPEGIRNPIEITVISNNLQTEKIKFYYLGPEIESISPRLATWGSEITISGNNFSNNVNNVSVTIDGHQAEVLASAKDELKISIPNALESTLSQIEVEVGKGLDVAEQLVTLKSPTYKSISTSFTSDLNEIITIQGNYFNPSPSLNKVSYNGSNLEIINSSQHSIIARMDESVLSNSLVSEEIVKPLNYSNAIGSFDTNELTLEYHASWSLLEEINFGSFSKSFQIGDKGYVITSSKAMYEFDLIAEEWKQLASFPGTGGPEDKNRYFGTGFVINDKIYYGLGYTNVNWVYNILVPPRLMKDFWEYDPTTNNWAQLNDIPDISNHIHDGISLSSKGYLIAKNLYEYDYLSDTWITKSELTENETALKPYFPPKSYILSGTLYCIYYDMDMGQTIFSHYNEGSDTWIIDYSTSSLNRINDVRVLDGKIYLIDMNVDSYNYIYVESIFKYFPYPKSYSTTLMEYNPITNNLTEIADPQDIIGLIPFSYNGHLYGDGLSYSHQFYRYDPNF